HLAVKVLDIPARARITYSAATGDFTYQGSSVIGELDADLTSTRPLVATATASHLRLVSVPTGLTGRLDSPGKTFTADLTGGAITTVEAQVTSGADDRLPAGTDGVMLHDHPGSYVVFLRVSGLQHAAVGWGATQFATL